MGISLIEAMSIPPFSEAKLIAGAAGLGRMVESANIQEVPDVDRWLHGGEIVFTAGYAFGTTENAVWILEKINHKGATAMAVKPSPYLPCIPREMIECADRLGLPLFELSENMPYMDCILPILERITQRQLTVMKRVESVHESLMQSILRDEGMDGICRTLSGVTQSPVAILSPQGAVMARWGDATSDGDSSAQSEESGVGFHAFLRDNHVRHMRRNQCNAVNFGDKTRRICVPIFAQDTHIAYLLLDKSMDEMLDLDLIAFENASSFIAIEILKEEALIQKEQKIREQFLEDLFMKRYNDNRVMYQRGVYVGFDMSRPHCVLVIAPDAFENYIYGELKSANETEVQNIKNRIHTCVRDGLAAYPGSLLTMTDGVKVVAMAEIKTPADLKALKLVLLELVGKLAKEFPRLLFSVGVGRVKRRFEEVGVSRDEAMLALRASRKTKLHACDEKVLFFEDLGCLCFLCELDGSTAMRNYYEEHMRALLDYDAENKSELIATLEAYFASNQNLRLTAERLFVHKNSVIYRLRKIEGLTGRRLSEAKTGFDMQLCLYLRSIFSEPQR